MGTTVQFLGDWGHVLTAGLFAALAIWVSRRLSDHGDGKLLVAALSLTAIWSLSIAFDGVHQLESGMMESLRNCGWLTCLFALPHRAINKRRAGVTLVYAVLVGVLVAQSLLDIFWSISAPGSASAAAVVEGGLVLRMVWTIGALLLIQQTFLTTDIHLRARMAPVMAAMAAMWAYDLILYATAYVLGDKAMQLFALRGFAMAALVPVIALTVRTQVDKQIQPSRALAMRGLGAVSILLVLVLVMLGLSLVDAVASPLGRVAVTGGVFAIIVAAPVTLPSARFRSLLKVLLAKHVFRHRYDYREQWMDFADTIGRVSASDASLYERAIKAVADITESPAGVLLLRDGNRLAVHSRWNWPTDMILNEYMDGPFVEELAAKFWVVDIDQARGNDNAAILPEWVRRDKSAWALVPIVHFDQLTGALLLARPRINRALDWEDFDMLRTAGRQVASYIAEAQGQQALADAQRFEEFNRRYAFIMHDIKNLVSQLSLVSRNAQRHADNPEFRADMVLTLQDCVGKMNDLPARLSQHNNGGMRDPVRFRLGDVVREVARAKGRVHPILTDGNMALTIVADPVRVEQIIGHLVQNAIDASAPDVPVLMQIADDGDMASLSIVDRGSGMSSEFVRNELFRPFASSKPDGFGIGALEARELAQAMRGRLSVESIPGQGSRFTLSLPLADAPGLNPSAERAA